MFSDLGTGTNTVKPSHLQKVDVLLDVLPTLEILLEHIRNLVIETYPCGIIFQPKLIDECLACRVMNRGAAILFDGIAILPGGTRDPTGSSITSIAKL
jgi:hypothetical protein